MELEDYMNLLPLMEFRERLMLGFLLMDSSAPITVIHEEQIDRRFFFFAETRMTFIAIEEMFNAGYEISPENVCSFMIQNNMLKEINGFHTINDYIAVYTNIITQCPEYSLEYLCNLMSAGFEYREMYFLTNRFDPYVVGEE